jgi:hypothetical protein
MWSQSVHKTVLDLKVTEDLERKRKRKRLVLVRMNANHMEMLIFLRDQMNE